MHSGVREGATLGSPEGPWSCTSGTVKWVPASDLVGAA